MATTKQILGKVVITNRGEYNSSTVYEILDVVSYQGSSYISKVYDNDSLPTDDTKWQLLAQKGDTYEVSETDIENIANQITENANSNFNKNVDEQMKAFNSNAETKTDEFNSNANTTVNNYNTNAEQKLREYNENDTVKLKEYNDNATSSVDNYNTNASTKLNEYNTNSDTKLKEYNDNATKKISEYNEHSKELNEKADSTRKELDRVKNEILDQGEANGSFIHLEDSAMAELQELEVEGICEQKTTTGKNLLDYVSNINSSINGIKTTINEDGSITVSGKPTTNYIAILKQDITDLLEDGNIYTISQSTLSDKLYIQINAKKSDGTYTYPNIQNKLSQKILVDKSVYVSYTLSIQTCAVAVWGNNSLTITNKYMLYKGTDTTESFFEPYTGGRPSPSPDYPQKIKTITDNIKLISCNKNLFNKNDENMFLKNLIPDNSGLIMSGITNTTSSNYIRTLILKCIPNTTYTISKLASKTLYIFDCEEVPYINYQMRLISNNNTLDSQFTFTTSKSAKYIVVKFFNTWASELYSYDEILSSIQIEETKQATSLVQHIQSQIITNIPEEEFIGKLSDTDKDKLSIQYNNEDGKYHLILNKMISKITLDGTEKWSKSGGSTSDILVATMNTNNMIDGKAISTHFKYSSQIEINSFSIYNSGKNLRICVDALKYADINSIKDWLSTHNTEIYYVSTEPYEVDLGICEMPITYNEITNIFTDSDLLPQVNVKYYRNFTKTIQNLQINNDTLKNELTSIEDRLTALENANATAESEVSE